MDLPRPFLLVRIAILQAVTLDDCLAVDVPDGKVSTCAIEHIDGGIYSAIFSYPA